MAATAGKSESASSHQTDCAPTLRRNEDSMCEIFGLNAPHKMHINEYLSEFFSHSIAHPNGWGMATLDDSHVMIEKEPVKALCSRYLKERTTVPIVTGAFLAHIRYATIGNESYSNSHPFSKMDQGGRQWTMVHNGTIFECPALEKYTATQLGSTDSERILLYIVDRIDAFEATQGRPATAAQRCRLLDQIVTDMAPGNKLNLILYDGEQMYVHTNYPNSLHLLHRDNGVIVSTQALSRENWRPVPLTRLLVFKEGQLAYEGAAHNQVYVDNDENLRLLYLAFSDL